MSFIQADCASHDLGVWSQDLSQVSEALIPYGGNSGENISFAPSNLKIFENLDIKIL